MSRGLGKDAERQLRIALESWTSKLAREVIAPHVPAGRPSIHMPRWACRLHLELTEDVRVERLQAITADEMKREGIEVPDVDYSVIERPDFLDAEREEWARRKFAELWDEINGHREGASWADNPWVWRVAFRRVEEA